MKLIKGSKAPHLFQKLQILLAPVNTLESCAKKDGDIFLAQTSVGHTEVVSSPQTMQEILTKVFMLVDHSRDIACNVPTRFWL